VPDGCVEIVLNLGDRFINAETGELQPRDLLAGQLMRPVVALPTGNVDLIGVRFKSGRAGAALRVPMWQLTGQLIAASSVMKGVDRLTDDLVNVTEADRLRHLAQELSRCLQGVDEDVLGSVDRALAIIDARRGSVSIESVARSIGITRRHLERRFRDEVGLGAKEMARIARIHSVLELMHQRPLMSGAEIAMACGYSDQAHLIRECKALTGQTPSRLMTTETSLAGLMREQQSV